MLYLCQTTSTEPVLQIMLFVVVHAVVILTFGAWVSQELLDYLRAAIVHPSFGFLSAALNLLFRVEIALESASYRETGKRTRALSLEDYAEFYFRERKRLALESFFLHAIVLATFSWIAVSLDFPWRDDLRAVVPVPLIFSLLIFLYAVNAIAPTFYYDWPVNTPEGWLVQCFVHNLLRALDRTPLRVCSWWIVNRIPPLEEEGQIWERRRFRRFAARSRGKMKILVRRAKSSVEREAVDR